MSKRYLRQLRADMANVEKLTVARHPARGSFAFRCWDRDERVAVLDGLARAERKAGVRVYGLLFDEPPPDGGRRGDDPAEVWRVSDRALVGKAPLPAAVDVILNDLGFAPPV